MFFLFCFVLFFSAISLVKIQFHSKHIGIQSKKRLIKCISLNIMMQASKTILKFHCHTYVHVIYITSLLLLITYQEKSCLIVCRDIC